MFILLKQKFVFDSFWIRLERRGEEKRGGERWGGGEIDLQLKNV